jgi:hypothetical protein
LNENTPPVDFLIKRKYLKAPKPFIRSKCTPGQVVEIVHDDSHEEIEHDE